MAANPRPFSITVFAVSSSTSNPLPSSSMRKEILSCAVSYLNHYIFGLSVLADVREGLLQGSVYHDLIIPWNHVIDVVNIGGRLETVMTGKIIDQPFESRRQADILEDGGTQVAGQAVHVVDDLVDVLQILPAFLPDRGLVRLQVLFDESGSELQDRQRPPEFIVEFSAIRLRSVS